MEHTKATKNPRPTIKLSDLNFTPVYIAILVILITIGKFSVNWFFFFIVPISMMSARFSMGLNLFLVTIVLDLQLSTFCGRRNLKNAPTSCWLAFVNPAKRLYSRGYCTMKYAILSHRLPKILVNTRLPTMGPFFVLLIFPAMNDWEAVFMINTKIRPKELFLLLTASLCRRTFVMWPSKSIWYLFRCQKIIDNTFVLIRLQLSLHRIEWSKCVFGASFNRMQQARWNVRKGQCCG